MEPIDRREFLVTSAAAAAVAAATSPARAAGNGAVLLSTWDWGIEANAKAAQVLANGGSLLDAVEKGINVVEDDPKVDTVGYGGLPNAQGEVELDAGIMDGTTHRAGAVCNLHKIKNPISVARLVMERTRHTTMAGEGALQFAIAMGFEPMQLLGVEDSGACRRLAARRLRLLCGRRGRRRVGDGQRRRHAELLHVVLHRAADGAGRASAGG